MKVGEHEVPDGLYYTKDHEWVKLEGNLARIGVTDYAQKQLGDVVYVELPEVGKVVKQAGGVEDKGDRVGRGGVDQGGISDLFSIKRNGERNKPSVAGSPRTHKHKPVR